MDVLNAALVKQYGIALTGGIATGKSTVAHLIAQAGHLVLDADQMSRETTAIGTPGLSALTTAFGPGILDAAGALDRKALGHIVFSDSDARRTLESLTHPMIRARLTEVLEAAWAKSTPATFFYEAPLLYEVNRAPEFRAVWATWCPREEQLARLMARGGLDLASAERIIATQMSPDEKRDRADLAIDTSGTFADVERRVLAAFTTLPQA